MSLQLQNAWAEGFSIIALWDRVRNNKVQEVLLQGEYGEEIVWLSTLFIVLSNALALTIIF